MAPVPTDHDEVFGAAQARRDRKACRDRDLLRRASAASGDRYPTVDDLLKGHPLRGDDIARDVREFVATASEGLTDLAALESLKRLGQAAAKSGPGDPTCVAILAALKACRIPPEADPDGSVRLRCVIYAALLGDVDAAQVVASEAALAAYVQDWHLEGDGSDLVWQAAAWSAYAASQVGSFRQMPYAITEMPSVRERVDAFAAEFRLKVGRLLPEVD